jgi:lysozyme family protein
VIATSKIGNKAMQANEAECIARVIASEGGYSNHPADPGGPTNWGITLADARRYWKPGASASDVRAMPKSVAEGIYDSKYWDALNCDALPAGLDYSLFDYGVNSGVSRAGKVLRRVVGLTDADWHVTGPVLAAVGKRDPKAIIAALDDERLTFLRSLKTWSVFGKGWGRRVAEVKAASLHMADGPAPTTQSPRPPVSAPSVDLPAAKGVVPITKGAKGGRAVVAGGGAATAVGGATLLDCWRSSDRRRHRGARRHRLFTVGIAVVHRLHRAKQDAPVPETPMVPALATV